MVEAYPKPGGTGGFAILGEEVGRKAVGLVVIGLANTYRNDVSLSCPALFQ